MKQIYRVQIGERSDPATNEVVSFEADNWGAEDGLLSLYKDGNAVAVFASGHWRYFSCSAVAPSGAAA